MIRLTPLLALLAVAACEPTPSATPSAAGVGNLAGSSWRIDSIAGVKVANPAGTSMMFGTDTVSGSFGCNSFQGQYAVVNGLLNVSPGPTTLAACSGDVNRQERSGLRHLAMPMQVVPNGPNMLILSGREGQSFVLSRQ